MRRHADRLNPVNRFRRRREDHGIKRGRTLHQFKNIGFPVPTEIEIAGRFVRQRPDGKKGCSGGMGDLERGRAFVVRCDLSRVNGRDRAGKADGRHPVERHGDGIDGVFIESEFLDGVTRSESLVDKAQADQS